MASFIIFFFFFFSLSSLLTQTQSSIDGCPLSFCRNSCMSINSSYTSVRFPDHYPVVTFPFHLKHSQNQRCGYNTSFELSCNNQNQTMLNLPNLGGDFIVEDIDYFLQNLRLRDPEGCFVRRLLNFTYNHDFSPFRAFRTNDFIFLNCSREIGTGLMDEKPEIYKQVSCLGGGNHTVLRVEEVNYKGSSRCKKIRTVAAPVISRRSGFGPGLDDVFCLGWDTPNCADCKVLGGACGLKRGSDTEIECVVPDPPSSDGAPGHPGFITYGIITSVGILVLLCLIPGCFYYAQRHRQHDTTAVFSIPITPQPYIVGMGLDRRTIESYPKSELGKSCRLPTPNDTTCSICLSDYQPSETVRTIPECGHYFHTDCIDEWLKMKGTCPLCRNSPEGSTWTPFSPPLSPSPLYISSR